MSPTKLRRLGTVGLLILLWTSMRFFNDAQLLYKVSFGILAVGYVVFLGWIEICYVPKLRLRHYRVRRDLPDTEFYLSYSTTGVTVEEIAAIRRDLSNAFGVPVEKLRPEDDFRHVGFVELTESTEAGFDRAAKATQLRTGISVDTTDTLTVDDYITFWAKARREKIDDPNVR